MKSAQFSAVIFDLDGLVLDTESTYQLAWQHAARLMGYDLSDDFCQSLSGLSGALVQEKLLAECGADLDLNDFHRHASEHWQAYIKQQPIALKHGFLPLLHHIQQQSLPYAIATNSPRKNALQCLVSAGIDTEFSLLISRDDVKQSKPAPDIFLTAAAQLQTPIAHCLVLEDSHTGVLAAHQAGAMVCYVPSTKPITETLALSHFVFADLMQVLAALRP